MTDLGTEAPDFNLPAAIPEAPGRTDAFYQLADFDAADVLVVVFTCNHCPYAVHVEDALIHTARAYGERGVAVVAISSNDPDAYPADSFENMAFRAAEKGFPFPYLFDASQDVASAYGAVCTPDFFVYDRDRKLAYRGRYDATRPGQGTPTGEDLHRALDALLAGEPVPENQAPSMGCNIKWKASA